MEPSVLDEMLKRYRESPPEQQQEMARLAAAGTQDMTVWVPQPGPQTRAFYSEADELFYGGEAGGGKTDLLLGLSITGHSDSLILRRENNQSRKLLERMEGIMGGTDGRSLTPIPTWRMPGRIVEFGGCQHESDKEKRKGIPHDLKGFDEICDFTKSQYIFIKIWNRSAKPGQRSRVVCTGNPPTSAEGLWVIEYWAAWLDPTHPNPAKDGELRWYISNAEGKDKEVPGPGEYEYQEEDGRTVKVGARSRTFIRAGLKDNIYLKNTDYQANLDSLPKELRDAYRDGRFDKAIKDNLKAVIPTTWILAAVARGKANTRPPQGVPMCAMGVDPAAGGDAFTTIAPRHDGWYAPVIRIPGKQTPLGKDVAAQIIANRRNNATIVLDMGGGYGGGCAQTFQENDIKFYAYNGANSATGRTKDGKLKFYNKRAETYWRFREALDPGQAGGSPISLPDSATLIADLSAPTFEVVPKGILVEDKKEISARLGRSPDEGDAVVMGWCEGAKLENLLGGNWKGVGRRNNQETANMGHADKRRGR